MKTPQPNARFWQYVNGSPVKITLRPGQSLEWIEGGPHDEGYSYERTIVSYPETDLPAPIVESEIDSRSVDCDGRRESHWDEYCHYGSLMGHHVAPRHRQHVNGIEVAYPCWRRGKAYQRDFAAEAAGY